jgi:hypothetical protein
MIYRHGQRWQAVGNIVWIPELPMRRRAQNDAMLGEADRRGACSNLAWPTECPRLLLTDAELE